MSEKVEQIARIICAEADVLIGEPFQQRYVCETVTDCESCMAKAHAVMAELREPTQAMTYAGKKADPSEHTLEASDGDISTIWRAMIDAALSDEVGVRIPACPPRPPGQSA